MSGNSFGTLFRITGFGESHGPAIGVVIDGCPPNLEVDFELIRRDLNRRKPGQSTISSPRKEEDAFEILSGVFEGRTLGTPIAVVVRNTDARSSDYDQLKDVFRPSHADYTYQAKYGIRDHRGGGRQSARETISRVIAGAFAKILLNKYGITIHACVSQVHHLKLDKPITAYDLNLSEANVVRCPDPLLAKEMELLIEKTRESGDSLGGIVSAVIRNVPAGLGEPVFDKLNASLSKAMFSINAVKGFDLGSGFDAVGMLGSEHNDSITMESGRPKTKSNNSGGIVGGISNGEDIYFRVAFKPVASIKKEQDTLNSGHEPVKLTVEGRHDPCVVPRAVPIVEAMAALVLADHLMLHQSVNMQPFA